METKKIIILASERSGTNLLRVLLNNHDEICGPVAPHFFNTFSYNLPKYGDLKIDTNSKLLLNHMLKLANHRLHDWNLDITEDEIITQNEINSFENAFDVLHTLQAKNMGKKHYVSKGNDLFNYTSNIDKLDNVKYIYLYRDPRDHVASWMRTPIFMFTPFDIINKWIHEQNKILKFAESNPVHFISYENLVSNTEKEINKIFDFLDIAIDEKCYTTNKENKESKRSELWKNLSKPIIKDNFKKYLDILSKRDVKIIESKAKKIMQVLKYDFDSDANWKPYKGFGYELMLKRKFTKRKSMNLRKNKMTNLQDKFDLIKSLNDELK